MEKTSHHELSPGKIILDTFAFARTRILSTAIDLEIFTHIFKGKKTLGACSGNKDTIEGP